MNKKYIIYGLSGVALVVGGYFIYKRMNRKPYFGVEPSDSSSSSSSKPSKKFPLKKGSEGKEVIALQKFLKDEGLGWLLGTFGKNKDGVDGKFGSMTEQAVKNQQSPYTNFKTMYPDSKYGEVSEKYYNMFIKGKY